MNKLQQLAAEATDLAHHDATAGSVHLSCYSIGQWDLTIHVHNSFAKHHCDHWHERDGFGVIRVSGDNLAQVIDEALERVADAVADAPCELIA